ncbi:MAG: MBL fold metallo-hydrolase [Polyangiales bacterium]
MKLRVLGCHGGETPQHRTSSFLFDGHLAVDAGAVTSMLTLEEQSAISSVLVSHPHLDHVRDLATLVDNRCQQNGKAVTVAGTQATIDVLQRHFFNDQLWPDFSKISTPYGPIVRFQALDVETPTQIDGFEVTPVLVNHSVETAAFILRKEGCSVAYSGDTGPTERLWEVLERCDDLKALLLEVSFPNEQQRLADLSLHHTPATLRQELEKIRHDASLPVLLYHIKPVFEARVERELAPIRRSALDILRLEQHFEF